MPSSWRLSGGTLRQTREIATDAVAGDRAWTDYRVSVRLRSDDAAAIGILFRYADEDNHYRFSLDAFTNRRQFERIQGGLATTIWSSRGAFTVGEPFTLTVDAVGSRLIGYLNNTRLFDLRDGAHATGQVGLFCFENRGARFERVEVRRAPIESYALLRDRFADADTADWTLVNPGAIGSSSWATLAGGWLQQIGDIDTPSLDPDIISRLGTQQIAGDPQWTGVIASARLLSPDGNAIGLLFRYTDVDHYYRFSMDNLTGYRRLIKNGGGTVSVLWEDRIGYELGRAYEVTVMAAGSTLRGYVDGVPTFVVWDNELTAGSIGLYCAGNQDARFAQVRVYPSGRGFAGWLLDESFPFNALAAGRWSFVGDPQRSHWQLFGGRLYGGSLEGSGPDDRGTYALTGASAWSDYRVSVRLSGIPLDLFVLAMSDVLGPVDRRGTAGPAGSETDAGTLRPSRAGTRPHISVWLGSAATYLERLFTTWRGRLSREVPSAWQPSAPVVGAPKGTAERPQSEAPPLEHVLNRIEDLGAGGGVIEGPGFPVLQTVDNGIIGVLVRYVDENHYYLFSMDHHRGRRRLVKKLPGTVCVLWEDNGQYDVGRDYIVTIDCVGKRLTGYVDGIRVFDLADSDFPTGRIGLYCGANSAASFREVRVAAPMWVNYYDFGSAQRLSAGSRVRVFSGNASDAPPEEQGVEHRFVASLGDAGQIRLPSDRADLRVVGTGAASGHARTFLPDAIYADFVLRDIDIVDPLDLRVLRKADGTGFFLVKPGGAAIPAGQYRLTMTYRRDNRAAAPNSQVFREAGSSDPEQVTIDIPTIAMLLANKPRQQ